METNQIVLTVKVVLLERENDLLGTEVARLKAIIASHQEAPAQSESE
jgi:hypothetical protein